MHSAKSIVSAAIVLASIHHANADQCGSSWTPGPAPAVNGINGTVHALLSWDHDNNAGTPNWLIAGGSFSVAGATPANNIAAWTGTTWQPFGLGTNGTVRALAVHNGQLVIGGDFTVANVVTVNHVARWNGTTFQSFASGVTNGFLKRVNALLSVANTLYIGGSFTHVNSLPASNVARWNGSTWSAMGAGFDDPVNSLVSMSGIFGSIVIAGGEFIDGNELSVEFWNGSVWSPLGDPIPCTLCSWNGCGCAVHTLLVSSSSILHAGGKWQITASNSFCQGTMLHGLALLTNDLQWQNQGAGCTGFPPQFPCQCQSDHPTVQAMAEYNGVIVAGDTPMNGEPLGGGVNGSVFALAVHNGQLVAGGSFTLAGGTPASCIAAWNGSAWAAIAPGVAVNALTTHFPGTMVAGGDFVFITSGPGGMIIPYLAYHDGTQLVDPAGEGFGLNGPVHAAIYYTPPPPPPAPFTRLIAGGAFTGGGQGPASRIARFGTLGWEPMGAGFNNTVHALGVHGGELHAGGTFTASGATTANRIAMWNRTTGAWQPLGSGMNGTVHAIASHGGFLYAGGQFTFAGGVNTGGLARWNGVSWSAVPGVGGVFSGTVFALRVVDGELVIGGSFPSAIGSPNLVRYDGASLSGFGVGGTNGTVRALEAIGSTLYAGGSFTTAGGVAAERVARWSTSEGWQPLGSGTNGTVLALRALGTKLHVGGSFTTAGLLPSSYWAIWEADVPPLIAYQPQNASVLCEGTASFSVTPVSSSIAPVFQWQHEGSPLTDGPQPNGAVISGANTSTLTIQNAGNANAGDYEAVLSNPCGTTTSAAAALEVFGCPLCPADVNGDGSVNVIDLLAVINAWNATGPNPADVNGDGVVNVSDLLAVINAWGACP